MSEDFTQTPPLDRETILDRANQARTLFNEGQRKFTVKALCRDRFRSGPMYDGPSTNLTDDDIIEAAYGAGGAHTYWRAWLLGASGRPELMQAIAAHCAVDQHSFHRIWRTLLSALDRAPAGLDLTSDTRWLADNPNTRCFIPPSLESTITPGETLSPPAIAPQHAVQAPPRRNGGRPPKYDWARAAGFLTGYVIEKDPQQKADLKRALVEWFDRQGKSPDDKDLRRFVDEVWNATQGKP